MAIVITNQTHTIKFDLGNDQEYHIDKSTINVKKRFGYIHVYGDSEEDGNFNKLKFKYSQVSSPVVASNDELITEILSYKTATAEVVGSVEITDGVETLAINPDGSINTTASLGASPGTELGNFQLTDGDQELDLKENSLNSKVECLVNMEGHVCDGNSRTANLAADATFTGTWEDTIDYGTIIVGVIADKDSAVDGLKIQWSSDGVNVHDSDLYTIFQDQGKVFTLQPVRRYFRVVYTNGDSPTTSINIETTLRRYYVKPSSHRIQDSVVDQDDAELVKAVITGENPQGEFQNVQVSDNGNFKVNIAEFGDTPSIDAFGRLRVAEPFTLFDSKQLHDKQPLFWDEEIGGVGTSTHNPINASVEMAVTASSSDYVIRQTKQRFNYQPGKSQLAFLTFYAPPSGNSVKRIGLFDGTGVDYMTPNNGIFFEIDGTISVNIAKNGVVTESVAQANWNVDKLNGSGSSGKTLDLNAPQILVIDYEWLGVGRVRIGFVIDGLVYYVHYFNHANDSAFDSVYMSTPNLPLRYDIQGNGDGVDQLDHICSTVISEGGLEKTGILRSADTNAVHVDATSVDTTYAIVGVRLKESYKDVTILPESLSVINENNDAFRWSLCLNPTIAGTFTYSDLTSSAVQTARGADTNTVSDEGIVIASGYASVDTQTANQQLQTALILGSMIDGDRDQLVLCVTPLSAGADIHASLSFRELI
jgi:hypothetical protein